MEALLLKYKFTPRDFKDHAYLEKGLSSTEDIISWNETKLKPSYLRV